MDKELRNLVSAVRDGTIRDPDRVRGILSQARAMIEKKNEIIREHEYILYEAERSFICGWVTK